MSTTTKKTAPAKSKPAAKKAAPKPEPKAPSRAALPGHKGYEYRVGRVNTSVYRDGVEVGWFRTDAYAAIATLTGKSA